MEREMVRSVKDYIEDRARSLTGVPHLEEEVSAVQSLVSELASTVEQSSRRAESIVSELASIIEQTSRRVEGIEPQIDALQAGPNAKIDEIFTRLNRAIGTRADYVIPAWYEWNFWEPSVQLALRDLCRPGETVFDVGVNAAALSVLMSRLVGPRGIVFGFEASLRIVDKAQFNLVQNGCANVQLFHRAVYRTTGERLAIFEGSHLNDSIFSLGTGEAKSSVLSVSLDDFTEYWGAQPNLIKMDVEGAEFDALMGSTKLIEACWPHLILELQPSDPRCIEWLLPRGYVALDLSTYRFLAKATDISSGLVNVLFIHASRLGNTPFRNRSEPVLMKENGPDEMNFHLEPGRYVAEALITAEGTDNEMMAGVEINGQPATRYHTHTRFLAEAYRFMPFHLDDPSSVEVFFRFQSETSDPTFTLKGVRIWKVPGVFSRTDFAC